jgi:hypothetical protein
MLSVAGDLSVYLISAFRLNESKALGENRRLVTIDGSSAADGSLHEWKAAASTTAKT